MLHKNIVRLGFVLLALLVVACGAENVEVTREEVTPEVEAAPEAEATTSRLPPRTKPLARTWHGAAYNPHTETIYITGGRSRAEGSETFLTDIWEFDTRTQQWKRLADLREELPDIQFNHSAAELTVTSFDSATGKLLLLSNDWADPKGEMVVPIVFTPATGEIALAKGGDLPTTRLEPGFVYHPLAKRFVMFGGLHSGVGGPPLDTFGDTWIYDNDTNIWELLETDVAPRSRGRFAMAYDSDANRILLFGGMSGHTFSGTNLFDTWEFDIASGIWQEIVTDEVPGIEVNFSGVYDTQSKRFIIYGRTGAGAYETWAFEYATQTWTNMNPPTGPEMNNPGNMVYSPVMDRVLIFGGAFNFPESVATSDDLWAYDFESNSWELLEAR